MGQPTILRQMTHSVALLALALYLFAGYPVAAQRPQGAVLGTSVAIEGFQFKPPSVTIQVGQSVTWTNNDSAAHTVTSSTGAFGSGTLSQTNTFTHQFTSAGTYGYFCAFHGSMVGAVTVQALPPSVFIYVPLVVKG